MNQIIEPPKNLEGNLLRGRLKKQGGKTHVIINTKKEAGLEVINDIGSTGVTFQSLESNASLLIKHNLGYKIGTKWTATSGAPIENSRKITKKSGKSPGNPCPARRVDNLSTEGEKKLDRLK